MSDLMLLGVLRMPIDPNSGPVALTQFFARAREAADRIESDAAEIERLRAALAQPPAPTAQPSNAIEDPVTVPRGLLGAACSALDFGRDAPKTLAELRRYTIGDLSQPVQQPGAEPNIIYSPIATKPQADGRHPNDNEPADPDRSHWLTMRGDDEGQGLDPYWKWGHAAGWNDHKKASPAQRQPLPPGLRLAAAFTRADLGPDGSNYPHVRELLAFAEQALGITAAPEAQKGEKL